MIAWFMLLASTSSSAATVSLHLGECVPERDLVHDLVAIEVGFERMIDRGGTFEVYVTCESDGLHVNLSPNPFDVEGRLIGDVASGGPRLVALNIVELIQDGAARKAAPVSKVEVKVEQPVRGEVREEMPIAGRIVASPTMRYLPKLGRVAWGARLGGAIDFGSEIAFTLAFDAGYERSDVLLELGSVRADAASASVQGGARFELGADFALSALSGFRGGFVSLSAKSETRSAFSGSGPWGGPVIGLRLRYGSIAGIALGIEGGWTAFYVRGEDIDGRRVGFDSGWFGADLAIDYSFGDG